MTPPLRKWGLGDSPAREKAAARGISIAAIGDAINSREDGLIVVNDTVVVKPGQFSGAVVKTILNGVKESGLVQPPMGYDGD